MLLLAPCGGFAAQTRRLLILGDSLSAAHNMATEQGWASLLSVRLKTHAGGMIDVVNASISGETSSGGAARIEDLLATHQPTHLLLELGANDSLRGLALAQTRAHLTRILQAARGAGVRILLIGIEMPVNYGRRYREGLRQLYADLAREHADAFLPHLLAPLGTDVAQFQEDRLHPTAAAQPHLEAAVLAALEPLLR